MTAAQFEQLDAPGAPAVSAAPAMSAAAGAPPARTAGSVDPGIGEVPG